MTCAVAKNPTRCVPGNCRARHASAALAAVALLFGFASGCSTAGADYTPGKLTAEQLANCRLVAQAYVDGKPEYPAMRDELKQDPVALAWFVRYLEHEIVQVREGHTEILGQETVPAAEVRLDPKSPTPWNLPGQRPDSRAIGQIVAIGASAVDVVVNDLVLHPQEFVRTIGIEVLTGIGDPAVPALLKLASDGESMQQRVAARALGEIGARGESLEALRMLAHSPIWRIRSDAAQGLAKGGSGARDLLMEMLADDDPFVRRKAGEALANYKHRKAANALIAFLEAAKKSKVFSDELAAQKALQIMAGAKRPRTTGAWRRFASSLPDEAAVKEIEAKEGGR